MVDSLRLKSCIMAAGYTQRKLSKDMEMSIGTLNNKINNVTEFNCAEVSRICKLLGITDPTVKCEIFLPNVS